MRKLSYLLVLLCSSLTGFSQQIPSCKVNDIIARTSDKDTTYIINFWATWCAPCVGELPEFNKLHKYYVDKPVKLLLVSLDFPEDYPGKLATFLQRKPMAPEVVWLDETDPNNFIPKIDNSWQGSIPATLIVKPGSHFKQFIEGTVTEKEIRKIVNAQLK